jgi:scyllo-inositol 2-dehydrogenase (NADP+)
VNSSSSRRLIEPFRVALVGYGFAGRSIHAPLITRCSRLRLSAIVTRDAIRQRNALQEYPGVILFDTADHVWSTPSSFDLVVICTSNRSHAQLASAAMHVGISVVVEKPFALSAAEAKNLADLAERQGVLVSAFQNRRLDCEFLTARRLIHGSDLGDVIRFVSRMERWHAPPQVGAPIPSAQYGQGALWGSAPHLVDQAIELFGPVDWVYAETRTIGWIGAENDATVHLHHKYSGVVSHLRVSSVTPAPGRRMEVHGTKAAFVVECLDHQLEQLLKGLRPGDAGWGEPSPHANMRLIAGESVRSVAYEKGDWSAFYRTMAAAMAGEALVPVDPQESVSLHEVLDAARRSAAVGEQIWLPPASSEAKHGEL